MAWVRLLCLAIVLGSIGWRSPDLLSDKNSFLEDFLDNDLLSTLGFISAVTLGSIANIHLQVVVIEQKDKKDLPSTKVALRRSAATLIILLGVAFLILIIKPLAPPEILYEVVANAFAILIVYVFLEVLWDITHTAFGIKANNASIT